MPKLPKKREFFEQDEEEMVIESLPDGQVRIKLSPAPPFDVPAATAIKMACILLKRAGWKVTFANNLITAKRHPRLGATQPEESSTLQ